MNYILSAFLLMALLPPAFAENGLPVHRADPTRADAPDQPNTIDAAVVDLAVHPHLDLLLAAAPGSVHLINLPDLSILADIRASGHVINGGFLNSDPSVSLRFFLVSASGRDVVTDFFEYDPGKRQTRRIGSDRAAFYRTLGSALLRQKQGRQDPFEGSVAVVRLNERMKPVKLLDLPLPPATPLYAFAQLADGEFSDVVRIETDGRPARHRFNASQWERVWSGEPSFGGSDAEVRALDRRTSIERDQGVAAADIDGAPGQEILAVERNRNPNPLGAVIGKKFETARVVAMDAHGRTLWTTDWLEGTIPALAVWRDAAIIAHVPAGTRQTRIYLNKTEERGQRREERESHE